MTKGIGVIHGLPKKIKYPHPKSEDNNFAYANIIDRVVYSEIFESGIYYRILDLLKWEHDNHIEIRFTYYYCSRENAKKYNNKPTENDAVWTYGQGAGHMSPQTFLKLIKLAKEKPAFQEHFNNLQVLEKSQD